MDNLSKHHGRILRIGLLACAAVLTVGCATGSYVKPAPFDDASLRARAESVTQADIRVSATIPSDEESRTIFGVDLAEKHIQPVWMEIENGTDRVIYFLRTGADPEYFAPREVAFALSESMTAEARRSLVERIEELDLRDPIRPRSTISGFIFTNRDRESKFLSVDLLSEGWSNHLVLVIANPERTLSEDRINRLYEMIAGATPVLADDVAELRELLEKLPCCASDEHGVQGEPLNVVIIGAPEATGPALTRRGFRYAPASPMYTFGRPQDLSLEKGTNAWVPAQPHVLRVWLTDIRYQDDPVWVGHISMPLGGRFADSADGGEPSTIDPDVDAARIDMIYDALYSQHLIEYGFVKGVGRVSAASPRTTPGGSTYYTDGLRAVMVFGADPVSLSEIEFIRWERLMDHRR
jgi:hypothetical protein